MIGGFFCPFVTLYISAYCSMDSIIKWFDNGMNYNRGLALYANYSNHNSRLLKRLNKAESLANKAILIAELRKLSKKKVVVPKKIPKRTIAPKSFDDQLIHKMNEQKQLKHKSTKKEFEKINYATLSPELKMRFRKAKDLFYDMCDLKMILNDLPDNANDDALDIQFKILQLDAEKQLIWKELEYFQKFKTELPSKQMDYSALSPMQLLKRKANLLCNITRMNQRIDNWYEELADCDCKPNAIALETKIKRSEGKLHIHRLNLIKVEELICEK